MQSSLKNSKRNRKLYLVTLSILVDTIDGRDYSSSNGCTTSEKSVYLEESILFEVFRKKAKNYASSSGKIFSNLKYSCPGE